QGTSDTGHYWCCTGSGTATFARGHKDHVCTFEGSFNFVDVVFGCLPPNLWVGTGTKSTSKFSTNVQFHFSRGHEQCLGVCVDGNEFNTAQSDIDHSVDSVHAAAADTNNFDDGQVVLG